MYLQFRCSNKPAVGIVDDAKVFDMKEGDKIVCDGYIGGKCVESMTILVGTRDYINFRRSGGSIYYNDCFLVEDE